MVARRLNAFQALGLLFALLLCTGAAVAQDGQDAPDDAWMKPGVLWRPREWIMFMMHDDAGTGFELTMTARDMNTYLQGPRPVMIWVTAPDGTTAAQQFMPDDGIVAGDERYRDGMYDPWQDFRYRQWHYAHSPGGVPPRKQRSPYLSAPEKLPPRTMTVTVPALGKGQYRVLIIASWDHWIGLTSNRPMPAAVHPGPGPMYVHGDRFKEAFFMTAPETKDVAMMLTEEMPPWSARIELLDEAGKSIARTEPKEFISMLIRKNARSEALYRLRITDVKPGTCLHGRGFPLVLAPNARTARLIQGGYRKDDKGRVTWHEHQRVLNRWADGLKREDLVLAPTRGKGQGKTPGLDKAVKQVEVIAKGQVVDRTSPDYGAVKDDGGVGRRWRLGEHAGSGPIDLMALLAGLDVPDNPYYGSLPLARRVLLARLHANLRHQQLTWWYNARGVVAEVNPVDGSFATMPVRSGWYGLGLDARHATSGELLGPVAERALPKQVLANWKLSLNQWIDTHWLMHVGETANQWTYCMETMHAIHRFTGYEGARGAIERGVMVLSTQGWLGRMDPDPTPHSFKNTDGYTLPIDLGLTAAGYLPEKQNYDPSYSTEQVMNLGRVWQGFKFERIPKLFDTMYELKTLVTLTKDGRHTSNPFAGTCSPTDFNSRTRYYTHKSGLPAELAGEVRYGDLWKGADNPRKPWPCLAPEPFVKLIDNKYLFVKTPSYYGISYGGPVESPWHAFAWTDVDMRGEGDVLTGSARCTGYRSPGYGGRSRAAMKPGGISAVYVPECGPTILSQNTDVMYSNLVWGRAKKPLYPAWQEHYVDPTVVAESFNHPTTVFDGRVMMRTVDLQYAPLRVSRTVQYKDDRVVVKLDLMAKEDLDLKELYEGIPYFAENRTIRFFGQDLDKPTEFVVPEFIVTTSHVRDVKEMIDIEKRMFDLPNVRFRAMDIANAAGVGATVILDKEYVANQVRPLKYRAAASQTGGFGLTLPHDMKAGDRHTVRYVVWIHDKPATAEDLKRVATEENLN